MTARLSVLALLAASCASIYETDWPQPVETVRVHTDDGWELDLRHIKATGGTPHAVPVVVQHGIVANGRNMDLDERHSIARALAARGFDVWVPSLRGTGLSEKPGERGHQADWSFDTYIQHDVPSYLAEIRARTGAAQVDWVGHSMGGMILYAYLSSGGAGVRRVVTMGSPVRLRWSGKVESAVRSVSSMAEVAARLPLRGFTRFAIPVQGEFDGPVERLLITPENTTPETWRRLLAVSVDNLPPPLLAQFAGWLERDRFDSREGFDYLAGLAKVTVPVFVMAGRADGLVPPWCARPAYDTLGSTEKRWWIAGEANGLDADYSHMDLVLGERAATEIFPRVAAWLER
jgi:pimeloyl-ACP methyl ester carboxylesterase